MQIRKMQFGLVWVNNFVKINSPWVALFSLNSLQCKLENCHLNIDLVLLCLDQEPFEWMILMIPHTCMYNTNKVIYMLSKHDEWTNEQTNEWTFVFLELLSQLKMHCFIDCIFELAIRHVIKNKMASRKKKVSYMGDENCLVVFFFLFWLKYLLKWFLILF